MNSGFHDSLHYLRLHIRIRFTGHGAVSHKWGPTLRGGFGSALRKISCSLRRDSCAGCPLNRNCAYGYLFETPILHADQIMRKYTQAPHPFVFEPAPKEPGKAHVAEQDTSDLTVILLGGSHMYQPYVILALDELGKMGLGRDNVPFQIEHVSADDGSILFDAASGPVLRQPAPSECSLDPGASRVGPFTIHLVSPLRLQHEGSLSFAPDLFSIVSALRRRLFLLRYFHDGGHTAQLAPDFLDAARGVKTTSSQFLWNDAIRSSTRQKREVPIGGLTGFLSCHGDIGLLEPLLRAGEIVHVGKNATFGLGQFRLTIGDLP